MIKSIDDRIPEILQVANSYIHTLNEKEQEKEIKDLEPLMQRLALRIFRIVVVGEVKKGKSSFINALLGETDLLPVSSDVATSTVFKIIYGQETSFHLYKRPEIIDEDHKIETAPLEINREALKNYGSQSAEGSDQEQVDFIGIQAPNPLLRKGLVLVDTPGLGSMFRGHGEITLSYVPNADAVFFILDSVEAVISKDEIDFLKHLYQITTKIIFIQTKIDAVSEEQWRAWKERNLDIISEQLNIPRENIKYFCVSAKNKHFADEHDGSEGESEQKERMEDLEDSGFPVVYDFLNNFLVFNKDKIIANKAVKVLSQSISSNGQLLKDRLRIANETNASALEEAEAMLKEVREKLIFWQGGGFLHELRTFNEKVSELHEKSRTSIQDEFFTRGQALRKYLNNIENGLKSESEVVEKADLIVNDYDDHAKFFGYKIFKEFQDGVLQVLNEAVRQHSAKMDEILPEKKVDINYEVRSPQLGSAELLDLDVIRTFAINTSVVYGMAHLLALGAALANPVAGILILGAGVLCSVYAGTKGIIDVRKRKLEMSVRKLEEILFDIASNYQIIFTRELDKISKKLGSQCSSLLEKMMQEAVKEFEDRLLEIQDVRRMNKKELDKKINDLKTRLELSVELDKRMREVSSCLKS